MKKLLKKWLLFLLGLLVLGFVGLTLVAMFWLGPLVKTAVEKYGPEVLGAEVVVEKVSVKIFSGMVQVQGLLVGNPEGFSQPSALEVGNFELNMKLASLRTDTLVIDDILIEQPLVTFERLNGSTNLGVLAQNAQTFADKLAGAQDEQKPPKKVLIKRLRVRDGKVRTKLAGLPAVTLDLPDIERTNIGGENEGGTNYGEAAKEVLGSLSSEALNVVKNGAGAIGEAGKKALEAGGAAGKKVLEEGGNALDAAKGIGDLFKK